MFCLFRVILPSQLNSALLYVDSMLIEGKRRFPKTLHTLVKQEIHSKTNVVQRLGASPLKYRCFLFYFDNSILSKPMEFVLVSTMAVTDDNMLQLKF